MHSARSAWVRHPGTPDSAPAGARLCPRLQALRGGRVPPAHRRAASGRAPRPPQGLSRSLLVCPLRGCGRGWGGLWPAAATGDCAAGHLAGAFVTEIGGPGTATSVRIGDAEDRALRLVNLFAAVVANQNGFPSHVNRLPRWNFRPQFTRRNTRREFVTR